MNDPRDTLERELESALAVDPSPDLQARIRQRIAESPGKPDWRWTLIVGFAAAAALVIGVVNFLPHRTAPSVEITPRAIVTAPAVAPPLPPPSPPEVRSTPSEVPLRAVYVVEPTAPWSGLNSTAIELPELALSPLPEMILPPMANLEPMTIEPFTLTDRETGVNQ